MCTPILARKGSDLACVKMRKLAGRIHGPPATFQLGIAREDVNRLRHNRLMHRSSPKFTYLVLHSLSLSILSFNCARKRVGFAMQNDSQRVRTREFDLMISFELPTFES